MNDSKRPTSSVAVVASGGIVFLMDTERKEVIAAFTPEVAAQLGPEMAIKAEQAKVIIIGGEPSPEEADSLADILTEQDQRWLETTLNLGLSAG